MSSYSSMLLCQTTFNLNSFPFSSPNKSLVVGLGLGLRNKKRASGGGGASSSSSLVPNAKERRKQSWWYKFFFDDDGNWLGLKEDDLEDNDGDGDVDDDLKILDGDSSSSSSSSSKFEAWKSRAEAITELRQAQEDLRNQEARSWEDWLSQDPGNGSGTGTHENENENATQDWEWENGSIDPNPNPNPTEMLPQGGLVRSLRNFLLPTDDDDDDDDDDDLLYEDRVLRYASINSAKFLVVLIIVPWALDFVFHDYVLMPFLDRYVKTVPLAAQMLDVRRNQKLEIVEELKMEKARVRLEVEIGKSPPLSEDDVWWELRHKALELREERRLHNRGAFANIASDMVFGISLFILLYCNQSKVALLKFTGYKLINNISDTGKAFLIILITDIFLGYHSESGWQTLLEIIVEHYGLEVDQSAITFFICLVPVIIDACVKLWLFKFLPRLSPKVATIFREMKRH